MNINTTEFQERIYDLICGNLDLNTAFVPESAIVKSEFEDGGDCAEAYGRMLDAYSRLCERLGTKEWEDADVEVVIRELIGIGKHLSMKMFAYGVLFGSRE